MKKTALALLLGGLALVIATEPAWAHGRGRTRVGIGISFGVPLGYSYWHHPFYYAPAYTYYPAPVVVTTPPTTYIEQQPAAAPAPAQPNSWWYYCRESGAYYPYVQSCPAGWQRVAPQPG